MFGREWQFRSIQSIFHNKNHYAYFVIVNDVQDDVFSLNVNILLIAMLSAVVRYLK